MAKDYVPGPDGDFLNWSTGWQAYAAEHSGSIGIPAPDLATLEAKMVAFREALNAHTAAQNAAQAACQAKDAAREDLEGWLRAYSQRVQVFPSTTDADRAGLGITVRDAEPSPTPVGETRPVPTVNAGQRLRHEIRWRDELSGKRAKPAGAAGCEVWVKVGEPPVDPAELRFLGLDSRSTMVTNYNGEDGGKVAHYMLRWVGTKGQRGPWSETASATIQN
jgi:hypothetical protein